MHTKTEHLRKGTCKSRLELGLVHFQSGISGANIVKSTVSQDV